MNKKEFASEIALDLNITKKDAETFVDSFLTTMTRVLAEGEKVKFIGFGTFGTEEKPARNGFNPRTKTPIVIPKRIKAYFEPGKTLEESL